MRVSCFFVSVAIIFAQQASAAPIIGLPKLPLIGNESGVMHSVSNTLEPVPLVGTLTGNVLESKSEGDLLSTIELTGNRGLINDDSRLGEISHSLERRKNQGLLSSLVPVTDSITHVPVLSRVGTLNPTTHRLTSQVGELDGTPILSDVTNNVSGLIKRDNAFQTLPFIGSIPGIGAMSSLPGLSSFSSMPSATSIPGLSSMPSLMAPLADGLPSSFI